MTAGVVQLRRPNEDIYRCECELSGTRALCVVMVRQVVLILGHTRMCIPLSNIRRLTVVRVGFLRTHYEVRMQSESEQECFVLRMETERGARALSAAIQEAARRTRTGK